MKKIILTVILISSGVAGATTRVEIFGPTRALIIVSETSQAQPNDPDAMTIFNMMNVPIQQSTIMGPGKAIVYNNQELNFVCGSQSTMGPMCTIVINPGPDVTIDLVKNTVQFLLNGDAAKDMFKLWNVTSTEHFVTDDNFMTIDISSDQFNLMATGNPLP